MSCQDVTTKSEKKVFISLKYFDENKNVFKAPDYERGVVKSYPSFMRISDIRKEIAEEFEIIGGQFEYVL